jgi:hypothetical protein
LLLQGMTVPLLVAKFLETAGGTCALDALTWIVLILHIMIS